MGADPAFWTDLEKGIELFNRREYYEAHEAWERRWAEEVGEVRQLLQGLIQVAAGFFKLQTGAPSGAAKLLSSGGAKLRPLGVLYLGVQLAPLLESVEDWRQRAEQMLRTGTLDYEPGALPVLRYQRPS